MLRKVLLATLLFATTAANAMSYVAKMVDLKTGKPVGEVNITQNRYGMVFTPNLSGIKIAKGGVHGFHVHEKASCAPSKKDGKVTPGGAAGGHYDPARTGRHGFPWTTNNHRGDLPKVYINDNGRSTMPVLAPRLKPSDFTGGRALMIHVGGDNYGNQPPLGGGGARMICGVIKKK